MVAAAAPRLCGCLTATKLWKRAHAAFPSVASRLVLRSPSVSREPADLRGDFPAAAPESDGPERPRLARVWIVDDSPLEGEAIRQALAAEYELSLYATGAAMLEDLASLPLPDALVVDWYMPDLSGLDICRFVRATVNLAQLPILLVTSSGTSEGLLEAIAAGANDFVRRPFSAPEFHARVSTLVRTAALHAQLARAEQNLRIEAEFRERFMGMLAHDLRQPLSAIVMASHALAKPSTDQGRLLRFLGVQQRATERMTRMIAELLDFTRNRPESGFPIHRRTSDLAEIARLCVDEVRLVHPERAVNLTVEGSCTGFWDPDRLAQVCGNLFLNAVEHGEAASAVEVSITGKPDRILLCTTNRGPALPENALPTLFRPFRQGRGSTRPNRGVGLGLHIVEQIVRAHGGAVSARSEDELTHFLVDLPRGPLPEMSRGSP